MTRPLVLVDCRVVSARLDGLGRYTLGLVRAMLLGPGEVQLALLVPSVVAKDHPLAELLRELRPEAVACDAGLFSPQAQFLVPAAVRRSGAALYHYPHFNLPFATPGRIVTTIHDLTPLTDPRYFRTGRAVKRAYFRLASAYTVRRSVAVITPTIRVARDVQRAFGRRKRIVAVPEGVAEQFAPPPEETIQEFRARYGLSRPYLLYVGVRRPHKNLDRVIRAFAEVAPGLQHDLVFAGQESADDPDLLALADRVGAGGRVRSLGYLNDADLPVAYAGADVFVLCSIAEGFGLGVLEAMRSGTPVITSASGATAEVAGDAAILVDPLSIPDISRAMRAVCESPDLRGDLRARGHARAALFSWRRAAERTLEIYKQAL